MENICNDYSIMPILVIIKNTLSLIQIIVPILLIIMASIQLLKVVKQPDNQKEIKKILNIFLAAIIVFFIPMIINVLFQLLGNNYTFSECWNNSKFSISNTYYEITNKKKNQINTNPDEYEKGIPNSYGTCLDKNKTTKILFVGNSKTYVHDIPTKFEKIASNKGYQVTVSSVTRGGATLKELANDYNSKITSTAYDCVIMQEQTDAYANGGSTYSNGINTIKQLVTSKNNNVKTYVRALWILKSSSSNELSKAYNATEKYAEASSSGVIYDGKAFEYSKNQYPGINLFGDERHQSEAGAYLSALVIYKTLSNDQPTSITYYANLSKENAIKLQTIAAK